MPLSLMHTLASNRRSLQTLRWITLCCLALIAASTRVGGQRPDNVDRARHFDARARLRGQVAAVTMASQNADLQTLQAAMPALAVSYDEVFGTTRTLMNRAGYLTRAVAGRAPLQIAVAFMQANTSLFGLQPDDVTGYEVTDIVPNTATGSTHVYLRQTHQGIPVYNAQFHVNVNRNGRVMSVNNRFVPDLAASVNSLVPIASASDAVADAARHLQVALAAPPQLLEGPTGVDRRTRVGRSGLSREPMTARLMFLPIRRGEVRLVWNFNVSMLDSPNWYDMTVDAETGEVWTRFDWSSADQYLVYPHPHESPQHTAPLPPEDGREFVVDPADPYASPFGWHDTDGAPGPEFTTHRGNNVHAYDDRDFNNIPPVEEPDCGPALLCAFPLDLTLPPGDNIAAAVANLFYVTNVVHDIQYQYGFTERAGNFQANNYGRGGLENDYVQAEAQDGAGTNNANFSTPPDGQRPRLQMFVFTAAEPDRDSAFDAGIAVHEYGHGISNRLVGGPSNVTCLINPQQPGEGLSDWWSLVYTAKAGDTGPMPRGMGTYALNQPVTGPGIRTQRYSTDPGVNTWTYASINGMAVPHGVGSVWAQAAWEMYWALVERHGFDPNLYNASGGAGNQRAMLYVNEGLMNTACTPTFVDVRDGILQAAMDNYGGEDVCLLWTAFAAFGLGADAISGGVESLTPVNGFGVPGFCVPAGSPSLSIGNASASEGGGSVVFNVSLSPPSSSTVRVDFATVDGTAVSTTNDTTYSNSTTIAIPGSPTTVTASPYPSSIVVGSSPGPITKVQAVLHGFSHQAPVSVDVLLQGPGGQTVVLMSDSGTNVAVSNLTLTFSDTGPPVPTALVSGTYRPTNNGAPETFPAPAPGQPYGTALSVFDGLDPVGTWNLYVLDELPPVLNGAISGGWSLILSTPAGDFTASSGTLTFAPGETSKSIAVPVIDDALVESEESFQLTLSAPLNAVISNAVGAGTILDNDSGTPRSQSRSDLVADFGEYGIWIRFNHGEDAAWSQLHTVSPTLITSGRLDGNATDDLVGVWAGFGTWRWMNNSTWDQLHPGDATDIETGDLNNDGVEEVILNLPGEGVWICCSSGWQQLHPLNSAHLAVANIDGDMDGLADVIVDFPGYGVWAWMNGTTWTQLHELNVANIEAGDFDGNGRDDLAMSFPGYGLFMRTNEGWTHLSQHSAALLTVADIDGDGRDDLAGEFPGYGVWVWKNNTSWVQLHSVDVSVMTAGDVDASGREDLLLGFPGFGLWMWRNDTSWEQLHDLVPEMITTARIDGSFR